MGTAQWYQEEHPHGKGTNQLVALLGMGMAKESQRPDPWQPQELLTENPIPLLHSPHWREQGGGWEEP